jgi:hypothetical protein
MQSMSQDRPSLAELTHRLREGFAARRAAWREWRSTVRQEPGRLWHSPLTKIGLLLVLALTAVLALQWLGGALIPGGLSWSYAQEGTREATLFVACTNPACRASYTTHQPRDFRDWPLRCKKCGEETVYRATRCPTCRQWYAMSPGSHPSSLISDPSSLISGGGSAASLCPFCAAKQAEQKPVEAAPPQAPQHTDDAEDPW